MNHPNPPQLRRELGPAQAISLVVGTIIGTGVFLKTTKMALAVGSPLLVLAAWAVAGLLSLAGALVYAELGELFPQAGGEYVYLRSAYGDLTGFLYGWQRFWIGSPGSIAAYAVGSATFLSGLTPLSPIQQTLTAVGFIFAFSLLNCLAVQVGGKAQAALTALKILLVLLLSVGILCFSESGTFHHLSGDGVALPSLSAFGMAVLAALWAFDGWNNLPMAAGEVKNPSRTIPIALMLGVVAVFALYAMVNVAYFYALPLAAILGANSSSNPHALPVATLAAQTFLGQRAIPFLAGAMVISALGAMNGSILTGSRVPFALAKDRIFPKALARISAGGQVPVTSVLVQGIWACALAVSGTFDQLTDWVVFASWIFYGLCGFSVLLFRRRIPEARRTYAMPLYPFLPLAFCALALLLLINTIFTSPKESLIGLLFISSGVPVFLWKRARA